MAFLPTISVAHLAQLQVGAYYAIKGTYRGYPLPPQVFFLQRLIRGRTIFGQQTIGGLIFWHMLGIQRCEPATLTLDDVNIPEHGIHDIHLERVPDQLVQRLAWDESWKEISRDVKHDFWGHNGQHRR